MDKAVIYRMPFAKVDEEKRTVSGFATLNNLDKQRDIVTTEASMKAFREFRGNIRELHTKIAAGKMLDYGVAQFHDTAHNKVYDGIFVKAYISKGAQDTWEKVLDGTLNGFSIGGEIVDFEHTLDEEGNSVRVIKEYELAELSLVDNPANPFANVVSIEKAHNFFEDIAESLEEKELNDMARVNKSDEGIVGTGDVVEEAVVEEVSAEPTAEVVEPAESVVEEPVAEVEEVVVEDESPKAEQADETSDESATSADPVSEAGSGDANVLAAAINEMKGVLAERDAQTSAAFAGIIEQLKELQAGVNGANSAAASVQEELASVKSTVSEFDKRVQSVEEDTAVRKSGDLGGVAQVSKAQTSKWGGVFLTADL